MKIVCIADTHNSHHEIHVPDGDLLIHAGDMTIRGTLDEINDVLRWLSSLPHKYKIFVAGNHDFGFSEKFEQIIIPANVIYLENSETTIEGFKIWGSPFSPPFYDWAFMPDLATRERVYSTIPADVDIVINHSPPLGVLDKLVSGRQVGCGALALRLAKLKAKLCVFGHIHEDYGVRTIGDTIFVNAAILNKRYEVAHAPVVVEI